MKRAILFNAWGSQCIQEIGRCVEARTYPRELATYLITDRETDVDTLPDWVQVERIDYRLERGLRKVETLEHLPVGYQSFLYLDSDTIILNDIELGFTKAEQHGIAMAPAPRYDLADSLGFEAIMAAEDAPDMGQMVYNAGVIFFTLTNDTRRVFDRWRQIVERHKDYYYHDQAPLTLAMEVEGFVPYVLSVSYNYRTYGTYIHGIVRLWHSRNEVPADLNDQPYVYLRKVIGSTVIYPGTRRSPLVRIAKRILRKAGTWLK